MNKRQSPPPHETSEEVSALIATLHETGQRLEELTGGEVDTVADQDGRTFVLRHAQERLRHADTARQAGILNALPAHIALLDPDGLIISVNAAWVRFARANAIQGAGYAIGLNYLDICDRAVGEGAPEGRQAAAGIRSVLEGLQASFALEYACHALDAQRWYRMTVTPLADHGRNGAVVMHVETTIEKRAAESLRESERRFSHMLENVELISLMLDQNAKITYCNDYLLRLTGWQREEVLGKDWFERFIPADHSGVREVFDDLLANKPSAYHHDNPILTRSGAQRLIRWSNTVQRATSGEVIGTTSIGEDITERQMAEDVLKKRTVELERFHRLSVGRELQMIELKKQVNALATQAGQPSPYDLAFLGQSPVSSQPGP